MTIRVRNTIDCARRLYASSVPSAVIDAILGKTFEVPDNHDTFKIITTWLDQNTEWVVPAECVEIISLSVNKQ